MAQGVHLDHRGKLHRHTFGQLQNMAGRDGNRLAEAAGQIYPEEFERTAGVDVAFQAGRAGMAGDNWVDHDTVARFELGDITADLDDHPTKLVPLNGRETD